MKNGTHNKTRVSQKRFIVLKANGWKMTAKDDPEQVWKEVFEGSVSMDDPCQPSGCTSCGRVWSCEMSGVTIRDTSHTWNVRNVVGVTLLSHIPPPHTISSTRTTPWIIQGVVPEKYFGSSKVLSPPREWPGPAYRKAPWALRRYRWGYPTPTIDKVSFCFVNPTYLL